MTQDQMDIIVDCHIALLQSLTAMQSAKWGNGADSCDPAEEVAALIKFLNENEFSDAEEA